MERVYRPMGRNHTKDWETGMVDWKGRARQLKSDIPAVFLALGKKETPVLAKILAAVTVGYALSPIDLIPDFIPVLGLLDDLILLPLLVTLTIKGIPSETLRQCRAEAEGLWNGGKPKRWYYALPIVLVWVALVALLLKWILA